jgi:dTDP-4-dehydrorhamnose reductase
VDDQVGAPTNVSDLASVIRELVDVRAEGIVHATNSGSTSWFGFAAAIVEAAGLEGVTVTPVGSESSLRPALRPKNSVLSLERLREILGWEPRPWLSAVREYITER